VLAELAHPPLGGYGEDGRALRARAAQAAGETRLAAALRDGPAPPAEAWLGTLPAGRPTSIEREIATTGRIVFPPVEGRPGDEFRGDVLGCVNFKGELFLLDTSTGGVVWRTTLPSGVVSGTPGYVEMHADGDRLLLISYARQGVPSDRLEAHSLVDGQLKWSRPLPGDTRSVVVTDGLLLRLAHFDPGDGPARFRLTGYGTASGDPALELDVPDCQGAQLFTAGGRAVLFTDAALLRDGAVLDPRLWTVDTLGGRLVGGDPLPSESSRLLISLDVPPTVLLAERGTDGALPSLLAWAVDSGSKSWSKPVPSALLTRQVLFPAGEGRALLFCPETAAQGGPGMRLVPVDAREGPLPETPAGAPVAVLAGQSTGRVPRLVLTRTDAPTLLDVRDARTAEHLYDVVLPAPLQPYASVVHGRDGFAFVQETGASGGPVTLRLFDGATGTERYSGTIEAPHGQGRVQLALAEGALVMAWGGTVHLLQSGAP
jgi:outer membrane protein assembly factor BamB